MSKLIYRLADSNLNETRDVADRSRLGWQVDGLHDDLNYSDARL